MRIGDVDIHPSATVNDLGVVFDSEGTMSAHVSNLCKKASFALRKIGKIRFLFGFQCYTKAGARLCNFEN